jgi:DNA mismatch repair ATPase MutS
MNYIADNVDPLIDQLRSTAFHSDERLMQYQQKLVQSSGINNIKLKYITNQ